MPRRSSHVHPVPRCLRGEGIPTTTFIRNIPWLFRGVASRLGKALGVADPHFVGENAADIVTAARRTLSEMRRGLVFLHLPDADRAGHEHGWMSEKYLMAARRLDHALGLIAAHARVDDDPRTLLIALADHGGGGAELRDHDSAHPLDRTIPLMVTGGCVRPSVLGANTTLLDVPATVLWSFGVPLPQSYAGKPLLEAFKQLPIAA
jgi:phosphopentomutase